jgi:hypothetical protein
MDEQMKVQGRRRTAESDGHGTVPEAALRSWKLILTRQDFLNHECNMKIKAMLHHRFRGAGEGFWPGGRSGRWTGYRGQFQRLDSIRVISLESHS